MWHWLTAVAFPQARSALRPKVREYFRFLYGQEPSDDALDRILWVTENSGSANYQQFNAG
jgi:hypothetical protein